MTRDYNKIKHEADLEYREKYYLPHPPQLTYRKYTLDGYGEIWALMAKQSSKELINNWEIFAEIQSSDHRIIKSALKKLDKTDLAIDWCTQWGTSTHQLAYSAKQVIGIETVKDAYCLACRNLAYMPETPGDYQMQMHECTPQTLSSVVSLIDWKAAGIIRIGSRSAPLILQQVNNSNDLVAHTIVLEYTDRTVEQLLTSIGYIKLDHKKTTLHIWNK